MAALKVPLTVVLGWEKCGAVAAAADVVTKDGRFPGSIGRMVEPIIPAVLAAQRNVEGGNWLARLPKKMFVAWSDGCRLIRN